jgi:hypothetical protein
MSAIAITTVFEARETAKGRLIPNVGQKVAKP